MSKGKHLERQSEREERSRHFFNAQKKQQDKKMMKTLEKALRSRDYVKLVRSEEY